MEPGHEDREYGAVGAFPGVGKVASMEPGHEDREYVNIERTHITMALPQWSPAMKTGNTRGSQRV